MPGKVFCGYCNKFKDADQIKTIITGRGSQTRTKYKCLACIEGGKGTQAERDAAGKRLADEAKAATARKLRAARNQKKGLCSE